MTFQALILATCASMQALLFLKHLNSVPCGPQIYLSCLESSKAINSTRCNDAYQSNTFNLLCTNSNRPLCRTYVYPSGIFDYRCASTTVEEIEHVQFTFEGQRSPGFSTITVTDCGGAAVIHSTVTDEASEGFGEPVTVTVQGKATGSPSAVTVYVTPQPPSESKTSSESDSSGTSNKSTPIGAIVEGVVGGLAVLGLIGLGAICLIRRQRKNKHQEGMASTIQPNMAYSANQNQYPYHPQHQGAVPPYTDARTSMMTGSLSPGGHGGGGQLPLPMGQSPVPAYEMAGSEGREHQGAHEMVSDSPVRK